MDDTHNRGQGPQVAVLGTGIMGSAMARNLVAADLRTTVWDRSPSATESACRGRRPGGRLTRRGGPGRADRDHHAADR